MSTAWSPTRSIWRDTTCMLMPHSSMSRFGDALEVQVDVEQRGEEPQVRGDRALEGEELHDPTLDLEVEGVDLVVGRDDGVALGHVVARHRAQRPLEEAAGGRSHALDHGLE